jgi:hypothetical protein
MVCEEDWEQRHPQDLLRVQREQISVPWSRPYPAQDTFIPENLWYKPVDSLGVNEYVVKNISKVIGNALATMNSSLGQFTLNAVPLNYTQTTTSTETFLLSESFLVALARSFSENVGITEVFSNGVTRNLSEALSLSETVATQGNKVLSDSLSFSETRAFVIAKVVSESVTISENTAFQINSLSALNGAVLNSLTLG